jgi:hypothetical protein
VAFRALERGIQTVLESAESFFHWTYVLGIVEIEEPHLDHERKDRVAPHRVLLEYGPGTEYVHVSVLPVDRWEQLARL